MRLTSVILENFRGYSSLVRIPIESLTAFVGKNDAGKSTVLEALEIFFNSQIVSLDLDDLSAQSDSRIVRIGCVFGDLPPEVVLDANASTSLQGEHLLNADGELEIHKLFDCSLKKPKESVHALAIHPTAAGVDDLLFLNNAGLKERARSAGVDLSSVDQRRNPELRRSLWRATKDLAAEPRTLPLDKEDAKRIWEKLAQYLPLYALFQADRPSKDEDDEVQDPMKLAVAASLAELRPELDKIKQHVQSRATEVAERTLEKLREMDPSLASALAPVFRAEPKWDGLFKLSLTGDQDIPINKRGSGVRRLILLNFFRAELERRRDEQSASSVILAIEEPETSQHPSNQSMLIGTLLELASQPGTQVILTTHVPGLAGLIPVDSLRHVTRDASGLRCVAAGSEDVFAQIASDLGVHPDNRVRALVCVEGPHDVRFLRHISRSLCTAEDDIPDLSNDDRVAFVVLGGSSLREWVNEHYLKGLNRPEVHLYDRDTSEPPEYQDACDAVNARSDGSFGHLTGKRELENYLHPDAIEQVFGFRLSFGDMDDVPALVAERVHAASESPHSWDELGQEKQKKKIAAAKRRLNDSVAQRMTPELLTAQDASGNLRTWLRRLSSLLN